MIGREIFDSILSKLHKGKVIIITGPRQSGKTTLLKQIIEKYGGNSILFLNCDEPDIKENLENATSTKLRSLIGKNKLVLIDEAQKVNNIGLTLKLIVDNIKSIQLIVTGSSAFDLSNKLNEPLTGRKIEYCLYPFSTGELINNSSLIEERRLLENRMIYGLYPDVVNNSSESKIILKELSQSYLYKDLFMYKDIRNPGALNKLITALALQIGYEVSYNELAQIVGIDKETVERYIELLEKVFVVFRLSSFSRNLRNEIKKSKKIYFYDNGVRNSIINNFNPLSMRKDAGELWENFIISERKKFTEYNNIYKNAYFWRTHNQNEIDYLEEREGKLFAYEIKWNIKRKVKPPNSFKNAYPEHEFQVITPDNYLVSFIRLEDWRLED